MLCPVNVFSLFDKERGGQPLKMTGASEHWGVDPQHDRDEARDEQRMRG